MNFSKALKISPARRTILLVGLASVFFACGREKPEVPVLARVGENYLLISDLQKSLPNGLSPEDSAEMASNFVQAWLTQQLLLKQARLNLSTEVAEIEKQVENYRNDLLIYAYEKELVRQKMDTSVSQSEILEFYSNNQDMFQLKDYILKVRYLKLQKNSPKLSKVEEWIQSSDPDDQGQLKDYSSRFALKFFSDTNWVYFSDLLKELPLDVYNEEAFLRSNNFVQFESPEHLYMIYVIDMQSKNTLAPLELQQQQIRNLILNKKKLELLATTRKKIYRDALSRGQAEIYVKPKLP